MAESGELAVEKFSKKKYDLVIIDENMEPSGGKLKGSEATRQMRQHERELLRAPALIFGCSGNCTKDDVKRSAKCGQVSFVMDWAGLT